MAQAQEGLPFGYLIARTDLIGSFYEVCLTGSKFDASASNPALYGRGVTVRAAVDAALSTLRAQ